MPVAESVVVALGLILADSLWAVGLSHSSGLLCLLVCLSIGPTPSGGFAWIFHGITSPSNLPSDRSPVKARTERILMTTTIDTRRF